MSNDRNLNKDNRHCCRPIIQFLTSLQPVETCFALLVWDSCRLVHLFPRSDFLTCTYLPRLETRWEVYFTLVLSFSERLLIMNLTFIPVVVVLTGLFGFALSIYGTVPKKMPTFNDLFPWVISGYILMVMLLGSVVIGKGAQPLLPPDGSFGYYSGPPLIRTPFLPNNFVLIREVSFGERVHYTHS